MHKPAKGSIKWRLPNLDESDYIWLRDKFLEVVGENMYEDTAPLDDFMEVEKFYAKNELKDEIRTHIKELFEESK